jgi:Raf kinase inhibitor-like YbhB/YbcL family protein
MTSYRRTVGLLAVLAALSGCPVRPAPPAPPAPAAPANSAAHPQANPVTWQLTSPAFANGGRIPVKYTGDGANLSPPLTWTAQPDWTKELVLVCDDPDAPHGTFTHWLLYGLASQTTSLPEAVPPGNTPVAPACAQGVNDFGKPGYSGPAPPPGKLHHYQFTLYALSAASSLAPGATRAQVDAALQGKILGKVTLVGTYSR